MKRCLLLLLCAVLLSAPVCAGMFVSADAVVYVTPFGEKYHKKSCSYVKTARKNGTLQEMTVQEAVEQGLAPCSRCRPGKWTGTQKRLAIVAPETPEQPPAQTPSVPDGANYLYVGVLIGAGGVALLVVVRRVWARKKKSRP